MTFDSVRTPEDQCQLHPLPLSISRAQVLADSAVRPCFESVGSVCSLKSLAAGGQSGFQNATHDPDGILRRVALVMELHDHVYPSLALAAGSLATASGNARLDVETPNHVTLTFGERTVTLDGKSNLLLRYRGQKGPFPYISAVSVMGDDGPLEPIKDRVAFVGTTALGSGAVVVTPLGTSFPGIEVQATIADNLLQEDFVRRPVNDTTLECLAVLVL